MPAFGVEGHLVVRRSLRSTGSVLNTAHPGPAGTSDGATQSKPESAASDKNRAADAPLRVNQYRLVFVNS